MALEIRLIQAAEYPRASEVVLSTFQHLAAQYQSAAGVKAFAEVATTDAIVARDADGAQTWVAVIQDTIIGVLQVKVQHIALLFVLPEMQSRGVGRALLKAADTQLRVETVNASANSVSAYMRYGFMPCGAEQTSPDGIRYVPMQRM
ncbi:GNAT family N-acetyltransferase [Deefgea rivuli]|uniref:GNAT family N-acetyltransferase n=1 Tax=Deefgea rivuli TaxID=400948 RepID=UPI00068894AB|nr:GNAT family N-acetyltransferase [Deefgea rivuli]